MARSNTAAADTSEETTASTEGTTEAPTEAKAEKKTKHDLPDTHVTPVGFAHLLKSERGVEVRPQVIYGYLKNSKDFAQHASIHTDGRNIVAKEGALAWWDAKEARKAEKAATAAAAPAEGETPSE
jgi:hypothetical protein